MVEPELAIELSAEDRKALREALEDMEEKVVVDLFLDDTSYSREARKLAEILEQEAPVRNGERLLEVRIYTRRDHPNVFREYGVERTPTLCLLDCAIMYMGLPAGEELRGLVETIIRVSQRDSGLDRETIEMLKRLPKPVKIEVIVTPQCPYCPYASLLANMLAFEMWRAGRRDFRAVTVEALENPDIADRYGVANVPAIVVNGVLVFVGVPYETDLVKRIIDVVEGREVKPEYLYSNEPV